MKIPVVATILLLLAGPAFARAVPPAALPTIYAFHRAYEICNRMDPAQFPGGKFEKACADETRLQKKLEAQGFCIRGHVMVGWSSKDKEHCYKMRY